ncbi:MAG: hypothetical protein QG637_1012 [Chloroflexota bacterium]|nr:hypothetical protein [Chloroflexota bacterium]
MTAPALRNAIDAFRANDVATILRTTGIVDIPKTKDGKTELWVKMIGDPARIRTALSRVNARCRKALQILQLADGEIRTTRFQSLLKRNGVLKEAAKTKQTNVYNYYGQHPENATDPGAFDEVLAALLKFGLIWTHTLPAHEPSNAKLGFEGGRFVYIPDVVARHLPSVAEPERAQAEIEHTVAGSARTCQRDLYLLWSAGREAPLQLTNAGLLRVNDLKRICGQLLISETFASGSKESDFRRIFFLRRLLMALGLLNTGAPASSAADRNMLTATPDAPFWQTAATARVQTSFQSWRDGAWWNELWATYEAGNTRASGNLAEFAPPPVVKARRKVLDTLVYLARRELTRDRAADTGWISFDSIADYLHDHDEEFLVDRETAERMYGGYYYTSVRPSSSPYQYNALGWGWDKYSGDADAGWEGVEATFIRAVLTEGLYWLGLVDLGYLTPMTPAGGAAPDGLQAVRLTDMGRWLLLDAAPPVIPAETGRVVVQPNFHAFAFDPISDAVLARLDSFATRLKAERAVEYEITTESIYRAQQNGQQVAEIMQWLEQTTGAPLPQNVGRSLTEWQANFERIIFRPRVGWLQTETPELTDALLANPALRGAIIKRVGPTTLMLHADKVEAVERALLEAEELPVRTARPEDARKASITVAADGAIQFAHAVPSLYVFGHLFPFADQTPALPEPGREGDADRGRGGNWRITPESVRRAGAAGLDAPAIIASLEALALGGVPAELQIRIKAWSKFYGDAIVQTLTLVQFRDQDTLNELRTDPTLARYIRPFKPDAKLGLAVVKPGDVAALQALLAERGINLTEH